MRSKIYQMTTLRVSVKKKINSAITFSQCTNLYIIIKTLYSPSNPSIYQKRRNRNAKKRDWNTERRKQQTQTWYMWERYFYKTSDGNIKRRKGQTKVVNRKQTNTKISISTKHTIRHEKQIWYNSKHSGWRVR